MIRACFAKVFTGKELRFRAGRGVSESMPTLPTLAVEFSFGVFGGFIFFCRCRLLDLVGENQICGV